MKKEWLVWNSLFDKSETGLGWDVERGTVYATNEWWECKIQKNPEVAKFRLRGLEHYFELDKLYMDAAATGERAWAPNFGQLPEFFNRRQSSVGEVEFGNDGDDDGDGNGDGEDGIESQRLDDIEIDFGLGGGVEGIPLPERQNKRGRNKGKVARKETSASNLSSQIDRLDGAVETRSSYSPTVSSDKSSDIAACVAKLETFLTLRGEMNYTS